MRFFWVRKNVVRINKNSINFAKADTRSIFLHNFFTESLSETARDILPISWQNRVYRMARKTKRDVEQVLLSGRS